MIRVQALGPVAVTVDGAAAPPELLWRKHLALLVHLARSPRRTRTRDHLIGLLWTDKSESAARHSLNEALRVLRRTGGDGAVVTQGEQVTLQDGAVALDVDDLDRAMGTADPEAAAALIAGAFMEGFTIPGASGFEDWLAAERRHWTARSVAALVACAEARAGRGAVEAAVGAAERGLALDPLAEPAAAALLRSLALAGDRAGALARYDGYVARLREELDASPSATVAALAERIRREPGRRRTAPRPAAARDRRAPLAGRDRELAAALAVWRSVSGGSGARAVAFLGDPGTGRSRLAEELAGRARLDGAAVTVVRAVPADRSVADAGFAALAGGGLLDAAGIAGAGSDALGTMASLSPAWRERFPQAAAAGLAPARALGDILLAAAEEQPVVLVLDDAHWLDRDSVAGLEAILRDLSSRPVLLVLTAPASHDHPELEHLLARVGRDLPGTAVRLTPLRPEALRALAEWAMPAWAPDQVERLTRRLALDSAGLPLLVVELLDAIKGGLDLSASAGAWPAPLRTLDQTLPGDLPDTVTAAIRVGYRRLGGAAQKVAAAAAVLPEPATAGRLARATGLSPAEAEEALDDLEWARWLQADGRGYRYVARIVREVVAREMLTAGQRERMVKGEG